MAGFYNSISSWRANVSLCRRVRTGPPAFMLFGRKDPSTEPVHGLDDPAAPDADEVLAQALFWRDSFRGRQRFFAIEVYLRDPRCQLIRWPSELAARKDSDAGLLQQAAAHLGAGLDASSVQLLPKGREVREEIETAVRSEDVRAGLCQAVGEEMSECPQNPATM